MGAIVECAWQLKREFNVRCVEYHSHDAVSLNSLVHWESCSSDLLGALILVLPK